MHECAITGHGPDVAADRDGFFHRHHRYGVGGPAMAATTISLAGAALSALMRATNSATGISDPPHSDDEQFCRRTVAVTSPPGASRGGCAPLQR